MGEQRAVLEGKGQGGSLQVAHQLLLMHASGSSYPQNMCLLESELESQLGEFHVKMKGKKACLICIASR